MTPLKIKVDSKVKAKFEKYPAHIKPKLKHLRTLIIDTAKSIESIKELEETLKWGEPSYLVKKGSTIRIDWKEKNPDQYAIYFKCTSKLVSTFKEIHGNTFQYEKHRAIIFQMEDQVPTKKLKECIELALTYHKVKHLPRLGR